tara:strand:+ start:334 stop:591 length:258 start_codon:yes stop_codon:yes gene_type:complete
MKDQLNDAEEYIENNMKADNGNMGLIAWRFLVGCRILECLDEIDGAPKQGTPVDLVFHNLDHSKLRFGDYEIYLAHKPAGEHESS